MSTPSATTDHFDLSAPAGGEILAVANAVCARAAHDSAEGEVVVVARTATGDLRSVGSRTSPVPASMRAPCTSGPPALG